MSCKIELIPISEGNRITIQENEKVTVGRGSSLGCNDKKISRQHAELLFKSDKTLWIKPTHTNPIFYRAVNGKTIHLTKDVEQELKDGDQIGLLPTSFFFRISFSTNNYNNKEKLCTSSDQQPYLSKDNLDLGNDHNLKSTKSSSKDISSKTKSPDIEPKSSIQDVDTSLSFKDECESINSNRKSRILPKWMSASTSSTTSGSTSASARNPPSSDDRSNIKRSLNSDEDKCSNTNDLSNNSNQVIASANKSSLEKSFDSDNEDGFDSVPSKKIKSKSKSRPLCPYGASCYRKNQIHRTEQSHPGDSDYEEDKPGNNDNDDAEKPSCPYGKSCYRQNPQHKRDYKH